MPIKQNPARQSPIVAFVDFTFADLVNGANATAISIPQNAVVLSGEVVVNEVFNSATTDVIDVGDAAVDNRYLNDGNLKALGRIPLVPTGFVASAAGNDITIKWVGTGAAPTTGKARLTVNYYVAGREEFTRG